MNELNDNVRWFCFDYHCAAGRPKMEDEIFNYARSILMHRIILEKDFPAAVTMCNRKQQELYEQNKRLREVTVEMSKDYGNYNDGIRWLYIGGQSLRFRRIEGEFNPQP